MSSQYYQQELEKLRGLAKEFAAEYPSLAPQLSGPSPDPDVERILEGTAFLTGQIRQKMEDDFPEFVQGLMQMIFPQYLRPIPSATIIEFTPKPILKNKLTVPSGTNIDSRKTDNVACRFRTNFEVDVYPLQVADARVLEAGSKKIMQVRVRSTGPNIAQLNIDSLRFHVGGDYAGAADTFMLLQKNLSRVRVLSADQQPLLTLGKRALKPVGFGEGFEVIPYTSTSFPAYRYIQEYFSIKEKYLFFDLTGLGDMEIAGSLQELLLCFEFDDGTLPMPRISADRFVLHATPAVNLFHHEADPVQVDGRSGEYRIRPSRAEKNAYDIHSVVKVVGRSATKIKAEEYQSFGLVDPDTLRTPVYQVTSRFNADDATTTPYLSLYYPQGMAIPAKETLNVSLLCSNGPLPSSLRPGEICERTDSTSELVEFRNLTPPTDPQKAPTQGAILWRLLSHLTINYLPLANTENLKVLLNLYIFQGTQNKQSEVANKKRVDGIRDVSVTAGTRLVRGEVYRGREIEITVAKENFTSYGDLYLFGSVLDYLFASFASLNSFTRLKLKDANSGDLTVWPTRLGSKQLL